MTKRGRFALLWAAVACVVVVGVVVQVGVRGVQQQAAAATSTSYTVLVGGQGCGAGWNDPKPGLQQLTLDNGGAVGEEVYLANATTGAVYLDVEGLGAAASTDETVVLGDGSYRFVCMLVDQDPVFGAPVTISGATTPPAGLTPGVVPVTEDDLIPASLDYHAWIAAQLPVLEKQVAALATDVRSDDLAKAKSDWLVAHLHYETLGAAYDAFGDYDDAINGFPTSGVTAVGDTQLTGFHRVEALLWTGAPTAQLRASVSALARAVTALTTAWPKITVSPQDIALRSHEIVENAIRFELTGETDAGSHSNLATIDANLSGAQKSLSLITGILASRYSQLRAAEASLASTKKLLETFRSASGQWASLSSLTQAQRERVDAAMDGTVALLAPVAALCDIRRASMP